MRQKTPFCAPPTDQTEGIVLIQNGGSARGYQETLRSVDSLDCGRGARGQSVYLCSAALGADVRFYRCAGGDHDDEHDVTPRLAPAGRMLAEARSILGAEG